jgi:tripartite-type tricarboxylate transporter receptor subunit TctC
MNPRRAALCVLIACAAGALPAAAQTRSGYPARPIRLIIPFAAGGASDYIAHLIERRWTDLARQEIVLELRPGANGNHGLEAAARAAPDGYTLLLGSTGVIAINPSLYRGKLRTVPARDLVPITQIADLPSALVAHPSLPAASAAELIAQARAKPGKLSFASPGAGSVNRLEMERFMQATGIQMVHRPYAAGLGHAIGSVLAGETAVMFVPLSTVAGEVRARKLKLLAVAAPERVSAFARAATLAEQGVPDMDAGLWHGVFAPRGTPPHVVATLHTMLEQVMAAPKVRFHLNGAGIAAVTSKSPQEFAAFLRAETERWARVVKESGATPG